MFRLSLRAARPVIPRATFRPFSASTLRASGHKEAPTEFKVSETLEEATGPDALFGPGGKPNEIPTDYEQATGLNRLEYLAKVDGIDLFDDTPLIQTRKGTPDDPVIIDSYDRYRYVGCTGFPAGTQEVNWLKVEQGKISRDWESGCCYALNYLGPEDDHHH